MLEYSFRAYDKEKNKIFYNGDRWKTPQGVYDNIKITHKGMEYTYKAESTEYIRVVTNEIEEDFYRYWDYDKLYTNCEIMQYTGKKDKNKVKIYEKDIVLIKRYHGQCDAFTDNPYDTFEAEVIYSDHRLCWIFKCDRKHGCNLSADKLCKEVGEMYSIEIIVNTMEV